MTLKTSLLKTAVKVTTSKQKEGTCTQLMLAACKFKYSYRPIISILFILQSKIQSFPRSLSFIVRQQTLQLRRLLLFLGLIQMPSSPMAIIRPPLQ